LNRLREVLKNKNLNYTKFFRQIDTNGDGLISCDEFLKGIGEMISIALPIRQKLFAYFDKMKIGLVNYKTFLSVLDP